ncbi:MAG: anti-sigma factor [Steroidobacteraceae bacterium]
MNTPADGDQEHLRYAEYALGVLDADARAAVAQEILVNDQAATAVALWQRQLAPLSEDVGEISPAPHLWTGIRQALKLDAPVRVPPRPSLWENLRLWQWLGAGASLVAAACLVLLVVAPPQWQQRPSVVATTLMVSTIKQENGVTRWTATMDLTRQQIVVVPASPGSVAPDRSTELWLIPAGQKPIPVGVFAPGAVTTLKLTPPLLAQLGPQAILAVSVEPPGGSPTGLPTGPVVGTGAISGAPSA